MCAGGGGGGGNPITDAVETVTNVVETVTDTVSEVTPDIKIPTALDQTSFEGSDLQTLVETPGEAVQTALGISDEDVEAASDAVSVDVGNVGTGLEFSVPTIGTPEFAASNMDWGAFAPTTPFVNPFASVDFPTIETPKFEFPTIKIPTALDQTSFANSDLDTVTNVISDTVDDLTPDSVEDLSNQISDNTPDIKNTITSTQDLSDAISDSTPDIKNTTTSTGDLADQVLTVPELLDKIDETGGAASDAGNAVVGALADAGTEVATGITDSIGEVWEGSDLDTFLEDTKDVGDFMLDSVISIVTGKPHGLVKDAQEDAVETQTTFQELGDNITETADNLGEVVTETLDTQNEVITNIATNATENVVGAADDVINAFIDAGILVPKPTETSDTRGSDATRGGDILREEDLATLGKKKSSLKAQKKKGKKGLRIDYGVNLPGMGKSGLAA